MSKLTKSYKQDKVQGQFDAIVIGSGLGGVTVAALLAKQGKKVLVLERHYTPGGFTHVFKRKEYEWDVGVHYVGEVHLPYAYLTRMFNYITDGSLQWAEMGDVYDKIFFGKDAYEYRTGTDEFKKKMKEYFPDPADQKAIDDYIALVKKTQKEFSEGVAISGFGFFMRFIFEKWLKKKALKENRTTAEVMAEITSNKKLAAVLTGQYGDYGLPPSQSSFVMHATLVKHYLKGGNYPVGGSSRIFDSIAPTIQKAGGEIFTNADVKEVLVRNNRAVGVRMADDKEILAPMVISDAGVVNTYGHLLAPQVKEAIGANDLLKKVEPSVGHVCLYVGLNHPKKELNMQKANYWIFPDNYDHDKNIAAYLQNPDAELPVVYISFPTAKDPDWENRHPDKSTLEIITLAPYEWYKNWEDKRWMKRGDDYNTAKEKLAQRLLEKLYEYEPSLRGKVDYYELSTPLSTRHFVNYQYGEIYGLDHSPNRFSQKFLQPQTPVKNLYLTGQDVVSCGVGGALFSGYLTTSVITGKNMLNKLEKAKR